jgi:thiamine pyrophosphokinase
MSRFSILLNGPILVTDRLKAQAKGTRALAADGGIMHAASLGLEVELWIGDFDSSSEELAARYRTVSRRQFPVAKDRTDGELAAEEALKRGATSLLLIGSFGGQSDHALGHFALGLKLARAGVFTMLTSGKEEAQPILPGTTKLDLPNGSRLSLIAFSDLEGVTLKGTRWPLQNADISLGSTMTLSNIALGPVEIDLAAGYGIAVSQPGDA